MSKDVKKGLTINPVVVYFLDLLSLFKSNIRDYGMYIALGVIFLAFYYQTGGLFLTPYNFSNLLDQSAYVAVLAVGMTLVIVTRQIDLSVGFLGAYLGATVVVMVENGGSSIGFAILIATLITLAVGAIKGLLVAKVRVPSFVVTLAGMFIFKGLLMIRTENRTVATSHRFFTTIGTGYLPTRFIGEGTMRLDLYTLLLGGVIILALWVFQIAKRQKNKSLGIQDSPLSIFITKLLFLSFIVVFLTRTLAANKGISFLVLITVVIVLLYYFVTTKTVLGRRIYAVGGNPEAAKLSGISVEGILIFVFMSMGILSMISGVMYVSMLSTASPNYGPFWELYAIAAAYIGGTSAAGGVGKVVNSFIGAIVIMSLKNGMAQAGMSSNYEQIVLGGVLLLAVIFDIYTRNVKPVDLVALLTARRECREDLHKARLEWREAQEALKEAKMGSDEGKIVSAERRLTETRNTIEQLKNKITNAKRS